MERIKTKVKKWGNSFGIIIPIDVINNKNLNENSNVSITIESDNGMTVEDVMDLSKKFKLKRKVNTQKVLNEIDKELWPEGE